MCFVLDFFSCIEKPADFRGETTRRGQKLTRLSPCILVICVSSLPFHARCALCCRWQHIAWVQTFYFWVLGWSFFWYIFFFYIMYIYIWYIFIYTCFFLLMLGTLSFVGFSCVSRKVMRFFWHDHTRNDINPYECFAIKWLTLQPIKSDVQHHSTVISYHHVAMARALSFESHLCELTSIPFNHGPPNCQHEIVQEETLSGKGKQKNCTHRNDHFFCLVEYSCDQMQIKLPHKTTQKNCVNFFLPCRATYHWFLWKEKNHRCGKSCSWGCSLWWTPGKPLWQIGRSEEPMLRRSLGEGVAVQRV